MRRIQLRIGFEPRFSTKMLKLVYLAKQSEWIFAKFLKYFSKQKSNIDSRNVNLVSVAESASFGGGGGR